MRKAKLMKLVSESVFSMSMSEVSEWVSEWASKEKEGSNFKLSKKSKINEASQWVSFFLSMSEVS